MEKFELANATFNFKSDDEYKRFCSERINERKFFDFLSNQFIFFSDLDRKKIPKGCRCGVIDMVYCDNLNLKEVPKIFPISVKYFTIPINVSIIY